MTAVAQSEVRAALRSLDGRRVYVKARHVALVMGHDSDAHKSIGHRLSQLADKGAVERWSSSDTCSGTTWEIIDPDAGLEAVTDGGMEWGDGTPQSIDSLVFVNQDNGAAIEYKGPFVCSREGASAEVAIPTDPDDHSGIHEGTAENLTKRVGDIGIGLFDASVDCAGIIEAADIIEGTLHVRIDGSIADLSEVSVDA